MHTHEYPRTAPIPQSSSFGTRRNIPSSHALDSRSDNDDGMLIMTGGTQAGIRHIYNRWHDSVQHRNLANLMALYADHATLESPLILATLPHRQSGILTGKADISAFFEAGLRAPPNDLGRWYRTGTLFSNGKQLTWEYPRQTPDGDQVDLMEMMDIADGLIVHHRVYWGWVGFRSLQAGFAPKTV